MIFAFDIDIMMAWYLIDFGVQVMERTADGINFIL
jgi:hypothetical protein